MSQVIMQFEPEGKNLEKSTRYLLEDLNREDNLDFVFPSLQEILAVNHPGWRYKPDFSRHVKLADVEDSHAIIWFPSPLEEGYDWFRRLVEGGYQGKKILIHTGKIDEDFDMGKIFGKHADHSFDLHRMETADLYKVLKS